MNVNTKIGYKYYRFDENNVCQRIRLVRIKNRNSFIFVDEETGTNITLTNEELKKYIKLIPDGIISFNIVGLDNGAEDVLVTLHRYSDIKKGNNDPYVCCRQSIFDLFANMVIKNNHIHYVGVSVNRDTCPPDVNFDITLACNHVIYSSIVNVYREDTLGDIVSLVSLYKYDNVLSKLADKMANTPEMVGYYRSLRELLYFNNFMFDFYKAFNILKINSFKIDYNQDTNALSKRQIEIMEDIIKHKMTSTCVIPFSRDIDLDSIQRSYVLVSDRANVLYLIAYDEGEYINRPYNLMHDNIEKALVLRAGKYDR